jgi:hypothetical protein
MRILLIVLLGILLLTKTYVPPLIKETQNVYSTLLVIQTEDIMIARVINDRGYPIVCHIVHDGNIVTETLEPGTKVQLVVESRETPTWRCKPI